MSEYGDLFNINQICDGDDKNNSPLTGLFINNYCYDEDKEVLDVLFSEFGEYDMDNPCLLTFTLSKCSVWFSHYLLRKFKKKYSLCIICKILTNMIDGIIDNNKLDGTTWGEWSQDENKDEWIH